MRSFCKRFWLELLFGCAVLATVAIGACKIDPKLEPRVPIASNVVEQKQSGHDNTQKSTVGDNWCGRITAAGVVLMAITFLFALFSKPPQIFKRRRK